ncbi:hypothetical protein HID58_072144, partial [Brassica napus]
MFCFVDDKEEKKGRSRRRVLLMFSLGPSTWDEIPHAIFKASKLLHGDDELLITDMPKEEVESLFDSYEDSDFSRIESTAVEKVELKRGLLEQFTHEMESLLGKQGMPVRLNKGCILPLLVQPDVDHVTVRWIPANNLFAITVSVIDQNPAQKNEDKLTIWGINSQNARDFPRPYSLCTQEGTQGLAAQ